MGTAAQQLQQRQHRPSVQRSALRPAAAGSLQAMADASGATGNLQSLQRLADGAGDGVAQQVPVVQPVLQRTVDSAAKALYQQGIITVKNSHLKSRFLKDHGVSKGDLAAIQTALNLLREQNSSTDSDVEETDMSDSTNWPTAGGMSETDGAIVAESLGWDEINSSKLTCSDPGHTPKGRVYQNGGNYYGADKDGHVGWGFKVWLKKKGNMLDYKGNISWNGEKWVHDPRGTK